MQFMMLNDIYYRSWIALHNDNDNDKDNDNENDKINVLTNYHYRNIMLFKTCKEMT